MKIRLASDLQTGSIVDGEGLRAVIWTQGCIHNCYGTRQENIQQQQAKVRRGCNR